jgi:hypothetical protein
MVRPEPILPDPPWPRVLHLTAGASPVGVPWPSLLSGVGGVVWSRCASSSTSLAQTEAPQPCLNCTRLLHDMAMEQEFMHANDTLH